MPRAIEIPATAAGSWKGGVAIEGGLPASGNTLYDARVVGESIYVWNGVAWVIVTGGGTFSNTSLTGTTDFASVMTVAGSGGHVDISADTYFQFKVGSRNILYVYGADGTHPQLTLEGADLWMEPGDGGSHAGSIVAYDVSISDIGYSAYQQGELPGFRPFRHLAYTGSLFFVPASERSSYTIASSNIMQLQQGGTVAGDNQSLTLTNIKALILKNAEGGSKYFEMYFGLSGINKMQTSQDFWINDAKFVSYSSAANKARAGTATLSGGTVTVTNVTITTKTKIFLSYNTEAGTPGRLSAPTRTSATSFVIQSSSGTDTSTVDWFLLEVES